MITNRIIGFYLDRLTIEDAIHYARKGGFSFTPMEMNIILAFARKNKLRLDKRNKDILLTELKKEVPSTTFNKVLAMTNKFVH